MSTIKIAAFILTLSGQIFTLAGAVVTARAVMLEPKQAVEIGVARYVSEKWEENLQQPAVQNLLRGSRAAVIGLLLVAFGTGLQIAGSVTNLFESDG